MIFLSCSISNNLEAQNERYQFVQCQFSEGSVRVQDPTTLKNGRVQEEFVLMRFDDLVNSGAAQFTFTEYASSASFVLEFTIGPITFNYKYDQGKIYKVVGGHQEILYDGGFNNGTNTIVGYDDSYVSITYNDQLLDQTNMYGAQLAIETKLTPIGSEVFNGEYVLTEQTLHPLMEANFLEHEIWVNEGEVAHIALDLSNQNNTTSTVNALVSLVSLPTPHLNSFSDQTVAFEVGTQSNSFDIAIPEGGQRDQAYVLSIEDVSGNSMMIGKRDQLVIHVIAKPSDLQADPLLPGDIRIIGYDNDIGGGDDQFTITNLKPLQPGASFQLVRATYDRTQDLWTSPSTESSGGNAVFNKASSKNFTNDASISAQLITYTGTDPLPAKTKFCFDLSAGGDPFIGDISVDGVGGGSFIVESVEGNNEQPFLELPTDEEGYLFIVTGQWIHNDHGSQLIGHVLDGLAIGVNWTVETTPVDVECSVVQGSETSGSVFSFFDCSGPFQNASPTDLSFDLTDTQFWITGTDASGGQNDFDANNIDICSQTCDFCCETFSLSTNCCELSVATDCNLHTVQWQYRTADTGFTDLPGATGSSLDICNITSLPEADYIFRAKIIQQSCVDLYTDDHDAPAPIMATYQINEEPIEPVSANYLEICGGYDLSISVSNPIQATTRTWKDDAGTQVATGTTFTKVGITTSATYTIEGTDSNGCTMDYEVYVQVWPEIVISFSEGDDYCSGDQSQVTANISGGQSPYSILWSNGETAASFISAEENSTVDDLPFSYHIVVIDDLGCIREDDYTLTVQSPPIVDLTSQDGACGEQGVLTFQFGDHVQRSQVEISITGNIDQNYVYTFADDGGSANIDVDDGSYDVWARWQGGDCSVHVGLVDIHVSELPMVNLTSASNAYCEGQSLDITATVSGGLAPYTYQWSDMSTEPVLASDETLTGAASETFLYHLTITDANGCKDAQSIDIDVHPTPQFDLVSDQVVFCGEQTVSLVVDNQCTSCTILWEDGSTLSTFTKLVTETQDISVTVTDPGTGCSRTRSKTIIIQEKLDINIVESGSHLCGDVFTLTVDESNFPSTLTPHYTWRKDGVIITEGGSSTIPNISQTSSEYANYSVLVTFYNGNKVDPNYCSDIAYYSWNVDELFTVLIDGPSSFCSRNASLNHGITLSIITDKTCDKINPNCTYLWSDGSTSSTTVVDVQNISNADLVLEYSVTLTDENGCTAEASMEVTALASPTVTATYADATGICGGIRVNFNGHTTHQNIQLSIDRGETYSYVLPVSSSAGEMILNDIDPGAYYLVARWDDESCVTNIGWVTVGDDFCCNYVLNKVCFSNTPSLKVTLASSSNNNGALAPCGGGTISTPDGHSITISDGFNNQSQIDILDEGFGTYTFSSNDGRTQLEEIVFKHDADQCGLTRIYTMCIPNSTSCVIVTPNNCSGQACNFHFREQEALAQCVNFCQNIEYFYECIDGKCVERNFDCANCYSASSQIQAYNDCSGICADPCLALPPCDNTASNVPCCCDGVEIANPCPQGQELNENCGCGEIDLCAGVPPCNFEGTNAPCCCEGEVLPTACPNDEYFLDEDCNCDPSCVGDDGTSSWDWPSSGTWTVSCSDGDSPNLVFRANSNFGLSCSECCHQAFGRVTATTTYGDRTDVVHHTVRCIGGFRNSSVHIDCGSVEVGDVVTMVLTGAPNPTFANLFDCTILGSPSLTVSYTITQADIDAWTECTECLPCGGGVDPCDATASVIPCCCNGEEITSSCPDGYELVNCACELVDPCLANIPCDDMASNFPCCCGDDIVNEECPDDFILDDCDCVPTNPCLAGIPCDEQASVTPCCCNEAVTIEQPCTDPGYALVDCECVVVDPCAAGIVCDATGSNEPCCCDNDVAITSECAPGYILDADCSCIIDDPCLAMIPCDDVAGNVPCCCNNQTVSEPCPDGYTLVGCVCTIVNPCADQPDAITVNVSDTDVCSGRQMAATATPGTFDHYKWYANGVLIPDYTGPFINSFIVAENITLKVEAYNILECQVEDEVNIIARPLPTAVVSGGTLTCHSDRSVTLSLTTSDNFEGWAGPFGYESTVTNPTVTVPGTYFATVSNHFCSEIYSVTVDEEFCPPCTDNASNAPCVCELSNIVGTSCLNDDLLDTNCNCVASPCENAGIILHYVPRGVTDSYICANETPDLLASLMGDLRGDREHFIFDFYLNNSLVHTIQGSDQVPIYYYSNTPAVVGDVYKVVATSIETGCTLSSDLFTGDCDNTFCSNINSDFSGGNETIDQTYTINGSGAVSWTFDSKSVPDRLTIWLDGQVIEETNCYSSYGIASDLAACCSNAYPVDWILTSSHEVEAGQSLRIRIEGGCDPCTSCSLPDGCCSISTIWDFRLACSTGETSAFGESKSSNNSQYINVVSTTNDVQENEKILTIEQVEGISQVGSIKSLQLERPDGITIVDIEIVEINLENETISFHALTGTYELFLIGDSGELSKNIVVE